MNGRSYWAALILSTVSCWSGARGQAAAGGPSASEPAVSYSSVSQLNQFLADLEQTSATTQSALGKLRVERWKTDAATKRQNQGNVDSLSRNLREALPDMITGLRSSPENLAATFKLYRNLDALYDVFSSVVESAGAFGSKDELQSLENDLNLMEASRRIMATRMEALTVAKESELGGLRAKVQALQGATPVAPPKKTIVDDTEPPKKPAKRKTPAKPQTAAPAPGSPEPATSSPPNSLR